MDMTNETSRTNMVHPCTVNRVDVTSVTTTFNTAAVSNDTTFTAVSTIDPHAVYRGYHWRIIDQLVLLSYGSPRQTLHGSKKC